MASEAPAEADASAAEADASAADADRAAEGRAPATAAPPLRAAGGPARSRGRLSRLGMIGDAVIVRHTLFSLPFAAAAILIETGGRPPLIDLFLILAAAAAARNAANAINRIVDAEIDARNPRTAGRHLPTGRLSKKELAAFAAVMGAILVAAAAMLDWLCVALLPVAAVLILGYSYTKRFTWLCHYWLGVACAAAPMGAFVALSGRFELGYFFMAGAVALWVAGFDILYALQDIGFDRDHGLKSVPARFGASGARAIAAASHAGTVAGLAALPLFWELSWPYLAGVSAAAALLAAEHVVVRGGTERHVRIASYSINEIVPLVVLAGTAVDIYAF